MLFRHLQYNVLQVLAVRYLEWGTLSEVHVPEVRYRYSAQVHRCTDVQGQSTSRYICRYSVNCTVCRASIQCTVYSAMCTPPLVEGLIAYFGISLDVFEFLRFGRFFPFKKKKRFLGILGPPGNHAFRWIRELWLKGVSLILAYL